MDNSEYEDTLKVVAARVTRLEKDVQELDQIKVDVKVMDAIRQADTVALNLAARNLDERLSLLPGQYATRDLHDTLERRLAGVENILVQRAGEGQGIKSTGRAVALAIAAVAATVGIIIAVNDALSRPTINEKPPATTTTIVVTIPAR